MKKFVILLFLLILTFSCSTDKSQYKFVEGYNELKIELLNEIIVYFKDNNLINTNPYFTLFDYPYFINLSLEDIKLERAFIYSLLPFDSIKLYRKNSLLIYDLKIIVSTDNSLIAYVGVFHRNEINEDRYYGLEFKYLENKWILMNSMNEEMENDYFFKTD